MQAEISSLAPVVRQTPETGHFLETYIETGVAKIVLHIADRAAVVRPDFLITSPSDGTLAPFAHVMEEQQFRTYATDRLGVCRVPDVCLIGTDGIVLQAGQVVRDSIRHIMYWHPDSVTESMVATESIVLKRTMQARCAPAKLQCMIGFTGSWRNYAHWLQESVPKLAVFAERFSAGGHVKIVLPQFEPGSFQDQTIQLLGIANESIITIQSDEVLHFQSVLLMSSTDLWSVPPYVHDVARTLVARASRMAPSVSAYGDRLFIHRQTGLRQLANFEALQDLILRRGYKILVPDAMTLVEQIAAMQGATHVVAEHGAGLTNILFCRPGTKVLEIFNQACVQPAFWSVAGVTGLKFGYLIGTHVPTAERPELDWNASYSITPEQLTAALDSMD